MKNKQCLTQLSAYALNWNKCWKHNFTL